MNSTKRIVFYSYKGGSGRTLALANVASYLARFDFKVCVIDMDLEAPGIHYKFLARNDPLMNNLLGLVDYIDYVSVKKVPPADLAPYLLRLNDNITIMPSGNVTSDEYWEKLSGINWHELLYEEAGIGLDLLFDLLGRLQSEPYGFDYILIDARAGVTPLSELCTSIFADILVLLFVASPESLDGTKQMLRKVQETRRGDNLAEIPVIPVLTRFEQFEDRDEEYAFITDKLDFFNDVGQTLCESLHVIHSDREIERKEQVLFAVSENSPDDAMMERAPSLTIRKDYLELFSCLIDKDQTRMKIKNFLQKKENYAKLINNPESFMTELETIADVYKHELVYEELVKFYKLRKVDVEDQNKFIEAINRYYKAGGKSVYIDKYFLEAFLSYFNPLKFDAINQSQGFDFQPKLSGFQPNLKMNADFYFGVDEKKVNREVLKEAIAGKTLFHFHFDRLFLALKFALPEKKFKIADSWRLLVPPYEKFEFADILLYWFDDEYYVQTYYLLAVLLLTDIIDRNCGKKPFTDRILEELSNEKLVHDLKYNLNLFLNPFDDTQKNDTNSDKSDDKLDGKSDGKLGGKLDGTTTDPNEAPDFDAFFGANNTDPDEPPDIDDVVDFGSTGPERAPEIPHSYDFYEDPNNDASFVKFKNSNPAIAPLDKLVSDVLNLLQNPNSDLVIDPNDSPDSDLKQNSTYGIESYFYQQRSINPKRNRVLFPIVPIDALRSIIQLLIIHDELSFTNNYWFRFLRHLYVNYPTLALPEEYVFCYLLLYDSDRYDSDRYASYIGDSFPTVSYLLDEKLFQLNITLALQLVKIVNALYVSDHLEKAKMVTDKFIELCSIRREKKALHVFLNDLDWDFANKHIDPTLEKHNKLLNRALKGITWHRKKYPWHMHEYEEYEDED